MKKLFPLEDKSALRDVHVTSRIQAGILASFESIHLRFDDK